MTDEEPFLSFGWKKSHWNGEDWVWMRKGATVSTTYSAARGIDDQWYLNEVTCRNTGSARRVETMSLGVYPTAAALCVYFQMRSDLHG
jgi:hypothetical protein